MSLRTQFQGKEPPWLAGLWIAPLLCLLVLLLPTRLRLPAACAGFVLAPLPAILMGRGRHLRQLAEAAQLRELNEQLRIELESIRYRTARLREELTEADRQARLSHQLALLGQFTAGFLHEFNNPLAIVTSRLEVLLEERPQDEALCADLRQMLREARYMGNIAGTLLRALRRERGVDTFSPCLPSEALEEAVASLGPQAQAQQVALVLEAAPVPRVDVPCHVIQEVTRGLVMNALQALEPRGAGTVWLRLEPYHAVGSRVILRVEDDGPGVPDSIREHLFEPFASQGTGRERLGLGLFLAASLLDTYDGAVRYEPRPGGGASFTVEMPPARFTKEQPYHWFVGKIPS